MLKIKAPRYATDLYRTLGLLLSLHGVATFVIACLYLNLYGEQPTDGLAYMLAAVSLLTIAQGLLEFKRATQPGNTRIALYASDRTLAIVRDRAPVKFIKRRDCIAVDQSGFALCIRDGTIESLGPMEFGGLRLQKAFLVPLYTQWCPPHTATEIAHYLDTRSKWKLAFTPYFFSGSIVILLLGFTTVYMPSALVFGLAATPWLTFFLVQLYFQFRWRHHPPPPERLCIAPPGNLTPPNDLPEMAYAED